MSAFTVALALARRRHFRKIGARSPVGSVVVTFDCYGGGLDMDASALRHRPEDAFLQLSNDLARQLHVPLLLEPHRGRDYARAFRKRLNQAAALLEGTRPDALLLVAIDSADNSVTAAQQRSPSEKTFVHELVSFSDLPRNVRLLVSARTGRRKELQLPKQFEPIELLAFDEPKRQPTSLDTGPPRQNRSRISTICRWYPARARL